MGLAERMIRRAVERVVVEEQEILFLDVQTGQARGCHRFLQEGASEPASRQRRLRHPEPFIQAGDSRRGSAE